MSGTSEVSVRVAQRALARHVETYVGEVQRLLDAGVTVMVRTGTSGSPRIADIVAEAGLSNDAFYRHFPSKGALVAAILEEGSQRLCSYIEHQMSKQERPEDKVRVWAEGVLSQTRPDVAATARAVMANASAAGTAANGRHYASGPLAALLVTPLQGLGSAAPEIQARMSAHAALGLLTDHLWDQRDPAPHVLPDLVSFLLAGTSGTSR